jgi:hypothetical protein
VNVDERILINRAQGGDPAAFEALVNQHARYVFNLALRLVHDPQEAENLSQVQSRGELHHLVVSDRYPPVLQPPAALANGIGGARPG